LSGGRLGGRFSNGFIGGIHTITSGIEAKTISNNMLHQKLITKQAPDGVICDKVWIVEHLKNIKNEYYISIIMDRNSQGPLLIGSSFGGSDSRSSISDIALSNPNYIFTEQIDIEDGLQLDQCERMVENITGIDDQEDKVYIDTVNMIYNLYHKIFLKYDCTQIEINPLAETYDGTIIACDVKINFDDYAKFRQSKIFHMRDYNQEDKREVDAMKNDINYIGLDGNIGCMVNGAGLAMSTMDLIYDKGGSPANFLDVGGGANVQQIQKAFEILDNDPNCYVVLINIFGGLMRCDVIAQGIINAASTIGIKTPLIIRLQGTNYEEGKRLIEEHSNDNNNVNIILANDLDDAATKAVQLAEEIIATKTTSAATNANDANAKSVIHPPPRLSSSTDDNVVVHDAIPKFEGFSL
jgi:succinyl-CoA synthetase beta subunit